jgi:hypothetical protein
VNEPAHVCRLRDDIDCVGVLPMLAECTRTTSNPEVHCTTLTAFATTIVAEPLSKLQVRREISGIVVPATRFSVS